MDSTILKSLLVGNESAPGLTTSVLTSPSPMLNTTVAGSTDLPWVPIDPPTSKCNYFIVENKTEILKFTNQFGGIPQNLVFNLIGWGFLMLLFAILRRMAGNYGRLALVRKDDDDSKWTQLFFAPDDASNTFSSNEDEAETEDTSNRAHLDSLASVDFNELDNGLCTWVTSIMTLSDEKYLRKCGVDAVQYLRFQRHLIFFVFIMTIICIAVILPVNFQGENQGTKVDFGHTTISNLDGTDPLLWVHIVIALLFLPLGVFIMRRFSVNLRIQEHSNKCISSRTLMLVGIPKAYCTKDYLIRHFHEAYPDAEIDEIQPAYDVSRLSRLDANREQARRARQYCENYQNKHRTDQKMRPFACGIVCCCGKKVEALPFYQREEQQLAEEVVKEKARIKNRSLGIAFITFTNLTDAKRIRQDHQTACDFLCDCFDNRPLSSVSNVLKPHHWNVRFAPPPEDIYWENLNDGHRFFVVKALVINVILFLVLFFFTSPTFIISQMEVFLNLNFKNFTNSAKINDFLPTLLLWTLSALLPIIVAYSDLLMGHWRRSMENLWIMRKVFFYLLFMVLILPSIGLTTLRAFVESALQTAAGDPDQNLKWSCIFLPDNGAFFVNYVITCALVGTALEFMRFSELFVYGCRMLFARSVAETPSIRRATTYEFPFGFNYGWMLLVFSLTSAYAVVCPLITPFGLFYMIMKHGVDRYNLYYAYKRSKIGKNIHATAVNCVIVSLLIQQLVLLFFNIVRSPTSSGKILTPRAIFSMTMLVLSTVLFFAQIFFQMFKGISPLQYTKPPSTGPDVDSDPSDSMVTANGADLNARTTQRREKRHKQFIPDVLRKELFTSTALVTTGECTIVARRKWQGQSARNARAEQSLDETQPLEEIVEHSQEIEVESPSIGIDEIRPVDTQPSPSRGYGATLPH